MDERGGEVITVRWMVLDATVDPFPQKVSGLSVIDRVCAQVSL